MMEKKKKILKFKHLSVDEETYWKIKKKMADMKIDRYKDFFDKIL